MTFRALIGMSLIAMSGLSQAQSTPIEQWQIIEGQGLTDNYVYLGMSRKEANTRTSNGNCRGKVTQCSFRAQDNVNAPVITLFFNAKNRVTAINFIQGAGISWPTTAGFTEGMTPEQILGAPTVIYPGPRPKKGQPGYRAGMTKKHNRGLPKNKRKMAEKSRKMNRGK